MSNKSTIELIKEKSRQLRGTLAESLADEHTGAIREDDQALIKFHGMYQQDDRDRREERAAKKLERLYSFMIRLRLPGGLLKPEQWLALYEVAGKNSTGVIKITSRQTLQLHGILKSSIRPTIKAFSEVALDTIATCGDVNRNVLCSANPAESSVHAEVFAYAEEISRLLMPKTRAYYEIWLGQEPLLTEPEEDPLYQQRYLPRKFKVGIAIPPNNDVDVLTNDVGLIAVVEDGQLMGFNITAGGGLSSTHGNPDTYPRLGTVLGFTDTKEKTLQAVYGIALVQRDFGNRSDRKQARLKYTIDRMGVGDFKKELEKRTGFTLLPARPVTFTHRKDIFGWQQQQDGNWLFTAFVENGRITDSKDQLIKTALQELASTGKGQFRFTCHQNVVVSDISTADKPAIEKILEQYGVAQYTASCSAVRKNAMACVAFPTCPLALAEAQRYMPSLLDKIEVLLSKYQLAGEEMIIRMTGCPNGCARSYAAEIGLVGTAYGKYNLHLGGDRLGERLNLIYRENIGEAEILEELEKLFAAFASGKEAHETIGDFAIRTKWV